MPEAAGEASALDSLQDLALATPPPARSPPDSSSATAPAVTSRVDSANPSPRRGLPLRELRPARPYFLNDDDDVGVAGIMGEAGPLSAEALRAFSPYEMLQRVSRSLSPIRYYLDGLGDERLGVRGMRRDDDDEEDEDEDEDDEEEDEEGDGEEEGLDEEEDSEISMGEEDDDLDSEDDDDEVLDLPGHR